MGNYEGTGEDEDNKIVHVFSAWKHCAPYFMLNPEWSSVEPRRSSAKQELESESCLNSLATSNYFALASTLTCYEVSRHLTSFSFRVPRR